MIGGSALAVHGYARFTADVDLLTMDGRVLDEKFWDGADLPEIRKGDWDVRAANLNGSTQIFVLGS
jgi:hypothetical protein